MFTIIYHSEFSSKVRTQFNLRPIVSPCLKAESIFGDRSERNTACCEYPRPCTYKIVEKVWFALEVPACLCSFNCSVRGLSALTSNYLGGSCILVLLVSVFSLFPNISPCWSWINVQSKTFERYKKDASFFLFCLFSTCTSNKIWQQNRCNNCECWQRPRSQV